MSRRRSAIPEQLGAIIVRGDTVRAPVAIDSPPVAPRDWELAVGTKIARRARPTRLERGVLHVRTASSTWAQELSLLADTICAQLRARGLDVRSLRFQVGPVEPLKRPSWRTDVHQAPEPAPLPEVISASLAKVPDDALRVAIERAAAASLGHASGPKTLENKPIPTKRPSTPRAAKVPAPAKGSIPTKAPAPTSKAPAPASKAPAPTAKIPATKGATSPRSTAPGPRSAGGRSARPDRRTPEPPAAPRGKRAGP